MGGHPVQQEAGGGDEAIAALLLHPRQAGEKLVGDVLPQARLAEGLAGQGQELGLTLGGLPIRSEAGDAEPHLGLVMDFAQVVAQALHLQPVGIRCHQAPGDQVVQGGAPQHCLLAPGVHGDVTANGGGVLGGGVHGENQPRPLRHLGDPAGNCAGATPDGWEFSRPIRQGTEFHIANGIQFFGVDHSAPGVKGYGRTRIACTAAAGYDAQPTIQTGANDRGNLGLRVRADDDERHLHAPVGSVRGMGHPCQTIKIQVIPARDADQGPTQVNAPQAHIHQPLPKSLHRLQRRRQKARCLGVVIDAALELDKAVA